MMKKENQTLYEIIENSKIITAPGQLLLLSDFINSSTEILQVSLNILLQLIVDSCTFKNSYKIKERAILLIAELSALRDDLNDSIKLNTRATKKIRAFVEENRNFNK